ncbi:ribbon-helix-helix protein, CopG family [Noviherbaspirillum aridicola]|uniref:Ribbon-helix-helix CopG family protein n=1 Tax=Noviherbaspirillum aridicola TaxID=2849687 RepID=A0ABQ4QAG8_9BURK|nr:ribbon-helix-helix protein, CopG family [Noviherbaspirillum aridicola]GIZ54071.1 hypothetical protein NCCP691_40850 [Noviherbaspirillum aridicola]
MGITKRPAPAPRTPEAVESFINGAPDAKVTAPRPQEDVLPPLPSQDDEEGSVQITLRIGKEQLARLTAAAKRQGIPRASYIKRAIALQLAADEKV